LAVKKKKTWFKGNSFIWYLLCQYRTINFL